MMFLDEFARTLGMAPTYAGDTGTPWQQLVIGDADYRQHFIPCLATPVMLHGRVSQHFSCICLCICLDLLTY